MSNNREREEVLKIASKLKGVSGVKEVYYHPAGGSVATSVVAVYDIDLIDMDAFNNLANDLEDASEFPLSISAEPNDEERGHGEVL